MANLAFYIMLHLALWLTEGGIYCLRMAAWLEDMDFDELERMAGRK